MREIDVEKFAQITLATYHLQGLDLDLQRALDALTQTLKADFLSLNTAETKEARQALMNIEGTTPEDYAEHLIALSDHRAIIAGIRHLNLDKDRAFVSLQTNFEVSDKALLDVYQTHLSGYFEKFAPQSLRYFTRTQLPFTEQGHCYLVQRASAVLPLKAAQTIALSSPTDDAYYDEYQAEYATFHQKHPHLANKVPLNSRALMEESRAAGWLREASINGERVGLIAGLQAPFLGHQGLYFIELLIYDAYRGRGLGRLLQNRYITTLLEGNCIVWGSIDAHNFPSLKSALANQRQILRYEHFIALF